VEVTVHTHGTLTLNAVPIATKQIAILIHDSFIRLSLNTA
jgi:hypothetical protein